MTGAPAGKLKLVAPPGAFFYVHDGRWWIEAGDDVWGPFDGWQGCLEFYIRKLWSR